MTDDMDYLAHYGVLRRSGRYPWGSGDDPNQRNKQFLDYVAGLKKQGLKETEIAEGMGITTTQLRAAKAIAKNEQRKADAAQALRLKEKGMSNVAIGERMGINESSVRALLNPALQEKADSLATTADFLESQVTEKGMIDIGSGVSSQLQISSTKLSNAVAMLQEKGYEVHTVQVDQAGTGAGKKTYVKVLAPPGTTYKDIVSDPSKIQPVQGYSNDGGKTVLGIEPPRNISSDRIKVKYAEEGGADADGVIYVRPGVPDISMGAARYAQVRIAVDGSHYLKGMAVYRDDLPDGVDLVFNTNKSDTGNKLDAMKPLKKNKETGSIDEDNPFGATIAQLKYKDANGVEQLSAMNIVNQEGDWNKWSKTLSSQMLSKQKPTLIKEQLDLSYAGKKAQYDEIMALTNPAVKKKLLESFADDMDASSVHLKAASLPRQRTQVILPFSKMKEGEIYAPNFRDGERVALVRFPHGGTFEIPELTVNNRSPEPRKILGRAVDAVGIHPKVAERLSGADFDGDTVLVIPNNSRKVVSSDPLPGLKGFDPKRAYPEYEGMRRMTTKQTQLEMGNISNLITDMTIRGASRSELERAVRHSMVVIDAEKHGLNYRQSYKDNGIPALKEKYQGRGPTGRLAGASTLISRASSDVRVPERTPRPAAKGGPIDPVTGKKVWDYSGATYTIPAHTKVGKRGNIIQVPEKTVVKTPIKSKRMAETDDAFKLSSGTVHEELYADYANRLKAMANDARKSYLATRPTPYSPSAKATYSKEVASLDLKLHTALQNAPRERQAQLIANATVSAKRQANPEMDSAELKRVKAQALTAARARTGASKTAVVISQDEWNAIQAGAITNHKLTQILNNADLDVVRKLATPRDAPAVSTANLNRAKAMLDAGYTQAEISLHLGIPTTTLNEAILKGASS